MKFMGLWSLFVFSEKPLDYKTFNMKIGEILHTHRYTSNMLRGFCCSLCILDWKYTCISAVHWYLYLTILMLTWHLKQLLLDSIHDTEIAEKHFNKGYISLCKFMAVPLPFVYMLCIILFLCLVFSPDIFQMSFR